MKFYEIHIENGRCVHGDFLCYEDALEYAESRANGNRFTIAEYESEEEYFHNMTV